VIETSEDPAPILRTFATKRALGAEFYVEDDPGIHADGLGRFTLTEDAPLSWDAFSRFITTLQALRGADLLRVTGVLNVTGCRGPVAVQFLQHLAHQPVELQAWPDDDRASRLTFVTRKRRRDGCAEDVRRRARALALAHDLVRTPDPAFRDHALSEIRPAVHMNGLPGDVARAGPHRKRTIAATSSGAPRSPVSVLLIR
jgi:hypothetical protein